MTYPTLTLDSFATYCIATFRIDAPLDDDYLSSLPDEIADQLDDAALIFIAPESSDADFDAFAAQCDIYLRSPEFTAIIDNSILARDARS